MGVDPLTRAVFLDRDGVLNANIFNPATDAWESPHHPDDFRLLPGALDGLRRLADGGFALFLVSNQPSYAKGKTSLENIRAIAAKLETAVSNAGIQFVEYYYCLHHPDGMMPGYSGTCACRKPSPYFLHKAEGDHGIDLAGSWMLGDRETDILCGRSAGVQTIYIRPDYPDAEPPRIAANYSAENIGQAVEIIRTTAARNAA